jgi:hypothetical protein
LENWFELEFLLLKIIRLQPSELEQMEFYRAEFLIENLKKHTEEENKSRKKEEEDYQKGMPQQPNASKMMSDARKSMPTPSFKMPSSGFGNLGKISL